MIHLHGLEYVEKGSVYNFLIMGVLDVSGLCVYVTGIPERLFPGRCDIWFQSHQVKYEG